VKRAGAYGVRPCPVFTDFSLNSNDKGMGTFPQGLGGSWNTVWDFHCATVPDFARANAIRPGPIPSQNGMGMNSAH